MAAESSPACFSREGQSSKSAKREDFAPLVLENRSDILFRVIMIDLIRAGTICIKSVFRCETLLY
jgi:hypothetical protein